MKKQQWLLFGIGILIISSLLLFGKTVAVKEKTPSASNASNAQPAFDINNYINEAKAKLSPAQSEYVNKLENSISRGDVKSQQAKVYQQLAAFWDDSVHQHEIHNYYTAEEAKLVNSEKSLTFAARLMLGEVRNEPDPVKRGWNADKAIELFEKAIILNPGNDSLKVGLGSCYIFGKGMAGDPQQTMRGIQQLLEVVRRDSTNMQAQLVLGIGGVISNQYDKAIERLLLVQRAQPGNLEAVSWLADAYAAKGDKPNAIKWYEVSKRIVNNPEYSKEVDERIRLLN